MMSWFKKHSIEIILLIVCCSYFGAMAAPGMSWVNVDSDGPTYLASARHLILSHPTGAPLYDLINAVMVRAIPFGDEYWRLCMVSAIAAGATCLLLYVLAKRYTQGKWKAMIAPLVYCASGLVVSQATILDTYALVTFISVLAYYFHVTGKVRSKYLTLACGIGIHHLILIPLGVFWITDLGKNILAKKRGEKVGFVRPAMFLWLIGFVAYLYVPIVNAEPYNWIKGSGFGDYMRYFFEQGNLIGGLSVLEPDGLQRLYDFVGITGLSFALSGLLILPGMYYSYKKKSYEGRLLAFLTFFYLLYYATDMAPQTYTYMMPAFAFGGLLAVKGLEYITFKRLGWVVAISSIGLMIFNIQTYDIGRTLDKELQCSVYYQSLDDIPDGSVLWLEKGGWWRDTLWLYNADNKADGGNQITVLPRFGRDNERNMAEAWEAFNNSNLLIQDTIDMRAETSLIRVATLEDFDRMYATVNPRSAFQQGVVQASWSNPVDAITGKVEMQKWHTVTASSQSAFFLIVFGLWGVGCTYVGDYFVKRNKAMDKRKRVLVRAMILAVGICLFMGICMASGMQLAI